MTTRRRRSSSARATSRLIEERRTIITEYASRLREILKLLRKRLH
jgi:hypothetical protein